MSLNPVLVEKFITGLEPAVLNEIERRRADVGYMKTSEGSEVDFLVNYPARVAELIQVCADPAEEQTRMRELRALMSAGQEIHPEARKPLLVLTWDQHQFFTDGDVHVQPAYEWMLTEGGIYPGEYWHPWNGYKIRYGVEIRPQPASRAL